MNRRRPRPQTLIESIANAFTAADRDRMSPVTAGVALIPRVATDRVARVVATDGRVLVALPVDAAYRTPDGPIIFDAAGCQAAQRLAKAWLRQISQGSRERWTFGRLAAMVSLGGERAELSYIDAACPGYRAAFPTDWSSLMPGFAPSTTIHPHSLAEAVRAIGINKGFAVTPLTDGRVTYIRHDPTGAFALFVGNCLPSRSNSKPTPASADLRDLVGTPPPAPRATTPPVGNVRSILAKLKAVIRDIEAAQRSHRKGGRR